MHVDADTCRTMPRHRSGGMYVSFSGRSTAPAGVCMYMRTPLEAHPIIPTSADTQIQVQCQMLITPTSLGA